MSEFRSKFENENQCVMLVTFKDSPEYISVGGSDQGGELTLNDARSLKEWLGRQIDFMEANDSEVAPPAPGGGA